MLSSRHFLYQLNLTIIKTISLSHKYSTSRKQHLIKKLNFENKVLYGSLLETQKQRRKSIAQESNNKPVIEDSLETKSSNLKNVIIEGGKSRGRPRKQKPLSSSESSSLSQSLSDSNHLTVLSQKDKESIVSSKNTEKKLKSNSKDIISTCSEFVFKPEVPINDVNYPLENPAKVASCSSASETVLKYKFSDSAMKYCINFPSVSTILEGTMSDKSRLVLNKWKQNMISDLGQEGFNRYFQDLKTRGHDFHSVVCDRVLGKPTEVCNEVTQNALKSVEWVMGHVSNPLAVESAIAHPSLEYKGIPDCVLHFRGTPVVVDWKLSDKPKKNIKDTYEAPVQITAYIGALNHDPNYKWAVNHGLVVVAYTSGDPCDVFLLAPKHCQIYWRHWLVRCDKFKARSHLHTDHVIDEETL